MYTRLTLIALLFLSFAIPKSLFGAVDEEEMKAKLPMMMGQNNVGKDYWFTIPPCYEEESSGADNFIKVLVTSPKATKVTVQVEGKGYYKTETTLPNGVIEFKLTPTQAQAILHAGNTNKPPAAKVYKKAGVHVFSDDPVVVYVVVRYRATSDGFLAIPTAAFGTAYINMVYKEPAITSGLMAPFTGITAAYDNTQVTFKMGGGDEGNDEVPLDGGRKLKTGETAKEYLDKGDVWLLSINGQRQDLSGSRIEGTKPFSIVSGVHCANFPVGNSWCDYTVEMELPIYTWGKQYYVAPKKGRKYNGIIRIFASEDDTEIFRDDSYIGTLRKGGGGEMGVAYHEMRVWPMLDDFGQPIKPKIATITGNKPISVMYYNTGVQEDGDPAPVTDPYMMIMTPIEQFQTEIYFPSPNATGGKDGFLENSMTLVFELDNGIMPQDLMFAEMSRTGAPPQWVTVSGKFGAGFEEFVLPYKGKKYATIELQLGAEGVYGIKSDSTRFAAYSHGAGSYDSYGFPTSAALNDLTIPDTNAPVPTYVQTCDGDVLNDKGIVTDMPNDDASRSNMADLYLIENLNENYDFQWKTQGGEFIPGQVRTLSWTLKVIDKKQAARATIYFVDRAGNDTTITIVYNPPQYEVVSGNDFGVVAETGGPVFLQDTIRNLSTQTPLYVTRVELQRGNQGFSIDSYTPNTWAPGMPIGIGEEVIVNIKFDPIIAKPLNKQLYLDSLGIGFGDDTFAECGFYYETEQKAMLGAAKIDVSDWEFPDKNINDVTPDQHLISITNRGDQMLKVFGIKQDLTESVFTHNFKTLFPNVSAATPLEIAPGKSETFTVFFKPTAEQTYTDRIVFTSNAGNNIDSIAIIKGKGLNSQVSVVGYDWSAFLIDRANYPAGPYDVAVGTSHQGFKLSNLGHPSIVARVVNVNVISESPNAREYFRVGNENIVEYLESKVRNLNLPGGTVKEDKVVFQPTEIGLHTIQIQLSFNDAVKGEILNVSYSGTGLVPNIEVSDVTYGKTLINDEAGALTGEYMVIVNNGTIEFGHELTIEDVTITNNANDVSNDITDFQGRTFKYDRSLIPVNTKLAIGDTLRIPVDFVARINGPNTATAEIKANANVNSNTYDNESNWLGEGYSIGVNIKGPTEFPCLTDGPFIYLVTISNTKDSSVTLDSIQLSVTDLNGDQIDDLSIISPTTGLVIPANGSITVEVRFDPSGKSDPKNIDLLVFHSYGNVLTVTGDKNAMNIGSRAIDGKTVSNVTGSTVDRGQNPPRFMVSIGDEFDYEIDFVGNANNADVLEFTVNVNYNRFYLQPKFGVSELNKIILGANMQVKAGSFAINDNPTNTQLGSKTITFKVVGINPNAPILTNSANIVKLPFLVVLPSDNEIFDPTQVISGKGTLGVFDMSHTLTGIVGCYTHSSDIVEVGVTEICTGTLRLLYIGNLEGEKADVTPNPLNSGGGTIEYSVPFDQQGEIEIYNTTMQKVATLFNGEMKQGRQSIDVPVSELANGAYYFKITMGQKQEMGRLIIQK